MSEGLSLVQKLVVASKLIKAVGKDGTNGFQKYSFQSEAAIKAAVKGAIESAGIAIIPAYEVVQQYDRPSNKGGVNHYVDVLGTFTISDGVDDKVGSMLGSGQDSGEKAMMKACTAAQKNFYKQLFNISDQESDVDPDAGDSGTNGPQQLYITHDEAAGLKTLVRDYAQQAATSVETFLATMLQRAQLSNKTIDMFTRQDFDAFNLQLNLAEQKMNGGVGHANARQIDEGGRN